MELEIFEDQFINSINLQLICEENEKTKEEEPCNFRKLEKAYSINYTKKYKGNLI